MTKLAALNLGVRFLIEVMTFIIIVCVGFSEFSMPFNILLGIVLPLIFVVLWAFFVAPKSSYKSNIIVRLIIELVIFSTTTILIYQTVSIKLGIIYCILVLINDIAFHLYDINNVYFN
ncbi:YrdB family protein [Dellaglioa sp. BT-FLS60]